MANENENLGYSAREFSLGRPLNDEEKTFMLERIINTIRYASDIVKACNEVHPGDSEEDRLKRVFFFSAKMSEFMVDRLEKTGAAVILDKEYAQAHILDMVMPIPALVEGFGADILKEK